MLNDSLIDGYRQNLGLMMDLIESEDQFGFETGGKLLEYRFLDGELYGVTSGDKCRFIGPISFILSHPLRVTKKSQRLSHDAITILDNLDFSQKDGVIKVDHTNRKVTLYTREVHHGQKQLSWSCNLPFYEVFKVLKVDGFYCIRNLIRDKGALVKWEKS